MRAWITLALALAVAVAVPAEASSNQTRGSNASSVVANTMSLAPTSDTRSVLSQGTFQSYSPARGDYPRTVTLRSTWNGMPVLVTYEVRNTDKWAVNGQRIVWSRARRGMVVPVPSGANVISISFPGGTAGVGTVKALDLANNTVQLQLPDNSLRTLRFAPNVLFVADEKPKDRLSDLHVNDTVMFAIPRRYNQIGAFVGVGHGRLASISRATGNRVTLIFREGGRQYTRTFTINPSTHFIANGQRVAPGQVASAFRHGRTAWIFGPSSHPFYIITGVDRGFQAALVGTQRPGAAGATGVTGNTGSDPDNMSSSSSSMATTTAAMTCNPAMLTISGPAGINTAFSQGTLQSYTPPMGNMPGMAVVQFNWNGTPVMGTYYVNPNDNWMSNGQPVNWTNIQPGTTVSVPSGVQVSGLTYGGNIGVGQVSSVNTNNNTVTLTLPNGSQQTLRYSQQALFLNGSGSQVAAASQLNPGQWVQFEVAPNSNTVSLFQPIQAPLQGTIASVDTTNNTMTVNFTDQNGNTVTQTYPLSGGPLFYSNGQVVSQANINTAFPANSNIYIIGSPGCPQFVASGLSTGFESAMIQPAATTGVTGAVGTTGVTSANCPPSGVVLGGPAGLNTAFSQGTLQAYTPAAGSMPAMATVQFTWNNMPVTATYFISQPESWMSNGQPVDWTSIQPGAMVTIPSGARLVNLTYGGNIGVGRVSSIDTTNNTITLTLPNGSQQTLRYSPQALFLSSSGQRTMVSQLNPGEWVQFEVAPNSNMVSLFQPIEAPLQGTIASVDTTNNTMTVNFTDQNGNTVSQTYPLSGGPLFYSNGQTVSMADAGTAFPVNSNVYIIGSPGCPQFIASGLSTGFESAMIQPTAPIGAAGATGTTGPITGNIYCPPGAAGATGTTGVTTTPAPKPAVRRHRHHRHHRHVHKHHRKTVKRAAPPVGK